MYRHAAILLYIMLTTGCFAPAAEAQNKSPNFVQKHVFFFPQDLLKPYADETLEVPSISTELSKEDLEIVFRFLLTGCLPPDCQDAKQFEDVFRQIGIRLGNLLFTKVNYLHLYRHKLIYLLYLVTKKVYV